MAYVASPLMTCVESSSISCGFPLPEYHPLPANTLSIFTSLKSGYYVGRQVTSLLLVSLPPKAGELFVTVRFDTLIIHVTASGSPAPNITNFTVTSHLSTFTTVTL
jgi:hypothetical protein